MKTKNLILTLLAIFIQICSLQSQNPEYPDYFSWDPQSRYFDPKSSEENPRWVMVDVEFVEKFSRIVSLAELKEHQGLQDMLVIKRGMRLSIQPVQKQHFDIITNLGRTDSVSEFDE